MAQSPGFIVLENARNTASGLILQPDEWELLVQAHSVHGHEDDQPESSQQPSGSKRGRSKLRKVTPSSSSPRSAVVSFEVPEAPHIGAVTTKGATLLEEAIWMPMDQVVIEKVF